MREQTPQSLIRADACSTDFQNLLLSQTNSDKNNVKKTKTLE